MSFKKLFVALLLIAFFISCDNEAEVVENKQLEKQLVGEWKNTSLKLVMNTFNNRDTVTTFEVTEEDWEAKMNIRPIRTVYFADGTYFSEHKNLRDSIIYNPAGKWVILGDTIFMRDTFPEVGLPYTYKVTFNKDLVEFAGIEDCDRDGNADDNYYGVQRKLK